MSTVTFGSFDPSLATEYAKEKQPDGMCEQLEFLQPWLKCSI